MNTASILHRYDNATVSHLVRFRNRIAAFTGRSIDLFEIKGTSLSQVTEFTTQGYESVPLIQRDQHLIWSRYDPRDDRSTVQSLDILRQARDWSVGLAGHINAELVGHAQGYIHLVAQTASGMLWYSISPHHTVTLRLSLPISSTIKGIAASSAAIVYFNNSDGVFRGDAYSFDCVNSDAADALALSPNFLVFTVQGKVHFVDMKSRAQRTLPEVLPLPLYVQDDTIILARSSNSISAQCIIERWPLTLQRSVPQWSTPVSIGVPTSLENRGGFILIYTPESVAVLDIAIGRLVGILETDTPLKQGTVLPSKDDIIYSLQGRIMRQTFIVPDESVTDE